MRKISFVLFFCILVSALYGCGAREVDILEGYTKSDCLVDFDLSNLSKVSATPTFNVNKVNEYADSSVFCTHKVFTDGMCLQRDSVNKIWGTCHGVDHVAVAICGKTFYGTVSNDEWQVYLPMMSAGGPYNMTVYSNKGKIELSDVYVGEVFLLCGQSNMEWHTEWSGLTMEDVYTDPNCENQQIRFFNLPTNPHEEEQSDFITDTFWTHAATDTILNFSALGYLFGLQLHEELNCPVGLIATAVGGSSIEYWLSQSSLLSLRREINTFEDRSKSWLTPCLGYNGLLHPLIGYNMRGMLWYQGESNIYGTQDSYDRELEELMLMVRRDFGLPTLTFICFELARFMEDPMAYSIINEKIAEVCARDEYAVNVLNLDFGEWEDIHPRDKRPIARRGADATLSAFFGKDKPLPPKVVSCNRISAYALEIEFDRDMILKNGSNGFEVLTDRGYSYDCMVTLSGRKVKVTSSSPINGVRYGYTCRMTAEIYADVSRMVTLYSSDGLPADLFIVRP